MKNLRLLLAVTLAVGMLAGCSKKETGREGNQPGTSGVQQGNEQRTGYQGATGGTGGGGGSKQHQQGMQAPTGAGGAGGTGGSKAYPESYDQNE